MTKVNALAAFCAMLIFAASFFLTGYAGLLVNAVGLAVVLSGTLGAVFLSYSADDLLAAIRVARNSYAVKAPTPDEVVGSLMDVSMRSRQGGLLALEAAEEEATVSFLKNALSMIVDRFPEQSFREILYTEMHFFKLRRDQHERVFQKMAQLAPSFGVAGSILGLIGMLGGIGDTTVVVQTIPVALTSTLYGVILSNLVVAPIAESIHTKTRKELLAQKIIVEGAVAVMQEENSQRLAKRLEAFMTPAARPKSDKTFAEIRERYRQLHEDTPRWKRGSHKARELAPATRPE